MTTRERAAKFSRTVKSSGTDLDEAFLESAFFEALREEILEAADELEVEAKRKEEMYAGLGLNGEDQARPFRDVAKSVRRRAEI